MITCPDCEIKTPKGRIKWQRQIGELLLNKVEDMNNCADIYGKIIYIINKELQKYGRNKNRRRKNRRRPYRRSG